VSTSFDWESEEDPRRPRQRGRQPPPPDLPLNPGATWVYRSNRYEGSGPEVKTAVYLITETVAEVQVQPPYSLFRIQRKGEIVASSGDWELGPESASYWYAVDGQRVYGGRDRLDLMDLESLKLQYVFPLEEGATWCPGAEATRGGCMFSGERTVSHGAAYSTPAGEFEACFAIVEM
jgi:hypothetical protein